MEVLQLLRQLDRSEPLELPSEFDYAALHERVRELCGQLQPLFDQPLEIDEAQDASFHADIVLGQTTDGISAMRDPGRRATTDQHAEGAGLERAGLERAGAEGAGAEGAGLERAGAEGAGDAEQLSAIGEAAGWEPDDSWGRRICLRISNFGHLVTLLEEQAIPPLVREQIRRRVEGQGFRLIAHADLLQPYDGTQPLELVPTWWARFFDYL